MIKKCTVTLYKFLINLAKSVIDLAVHIFNSWPRAVIGIIILMVVLYYPIGGSMIENIDRTTDYEIVQEEKKSPTINMMHMLIDRETDKHIWTANLPLFFPSYFLDNMPNYQTGMIEAMSVVAEPISKQIQCPEEEKENIYMKTAAELLTYPGNVWIFLPDNKLKISPSSSSQYRKARKKLIDTNEALNNEICFWHKSPANLSAIITKIQKDLNDTGAILERQINEESTSWLDMLSDDIFYKSQGKLYVYTMMLKALAYDYKETILAKNLYQDWTKAVKALETAAEINPQMVRNGEFNSSFSSNHLIILGYYAAKAENILININNNLIKEN